MLSATRYVLRFKNTAQWKSTEKNTTAWVEHRAAIFQQATARFCCPLSEDEKQKSANLVWRGEDGLPDLETTTPCARDRHNLLTQIIIGHIYKKRTKKNKKTWTHPHFGNTHKSSMGTQKIKSGMDTQEKIMDTPETQRNHRHTQKQIMWWTHSRDITDTLREIAHTKTNHGWAHSEITRHTHKNNSSMGTLREIMGHPKTDHEWTHSEKSQTQTKPNHGGTHSEKPWTHKDAPLPSPEFPIFLGRGALPNPSAKTSDCTADPPAEPEVGGGGARAYRW